MKIWILKLCVDNYANFPEMVSASCTTKSGSDPTGVEEDKRVAWFNIYDTLLTKFWCYYVIVVR